MGCHSSQCASGGLSTVIRFQMRPEAGLPSCRDRKSYLSVFTFHTFELSADTNTSMEAPEDIDDEGSDYPNPIQTP